MSFHTDNTERLRAGNLAQELLTDNKQLQVLMPLLQKYQHSKNRSTTGVGSGDGSYLYVSGNDFLFAKQGIAQTCALYFWYGENAYRPMLWAYFCKTNTASTRADNCTYMAAMKL